MQVLQGRGGLLWRSSWWLALVVLMVIVWPFWAMAQDADCAEVKIVIKQKLSLERQAFDAHMVIRNGLDEALSNVKVELTFLDQDQQPVVATTDPNAEGATFFQRIDRMTGIGSLDGSGNLAGKTDGDIHWLIIPAQGSGGDTANGRMYYIGARVTYTLAGETTTVDVTPDYVLVRPQPLLVLDYFLPDDVYADDALTPEVEPTEPFTLGVRISNVGAGVSAKTMIESAQPQIVENHQGLLIDFRILGGYVGNDMLGKSMLLDFGDISGQSAKVGRWLMETSLAGRFVEFNARFTHADSLGGAVTSLIQEVHTHKLVHDVLVDLPGHDDIYDFLVGFGTGYRVYDSSGGDAEVADASGLANLTSVSGGNLRLAFPASSSLIHTKVTDPFKGLKPITRVIRSDGKVLPANNFWLSKTRNVDLSWSYFLHVFDSSSTGDYTLEFGQGAVGSLSGSAYRDSNANGVRDTGEPAEGNLGIVLKGIDTQGQNILRQGYTEPSGAFSFTGLAPGRYQLEAAVVDGWIDGVWMAGSAGGVAQPGLIKDIVLAAGTAGTGYLIAKQRPDASPGLSEQQADVSIGIETDRSRLHSGETANVVVTVHNAGESAAQGITAQVAVPDGLVLQNTSVSLGRYANGAWVMGDLAKGQRATLTLGVKADNVVGNKDLSISWPASVSTSTSDPQTANNSTRLGLTILADKRVEMLQSLPAESRVLMLLSCPQIDAAEQAACEQDAEQTAYTVLRGTAKQLQTVTTLAAWRIAQRSGTYNVLWLHGGADKLDQQTLAEIRAAVRRGATIVADGLPGVAGSEFRLNQLADVMGAKVAVPAVGSNHSVKFANEPTAQPVVGVLHGLQLDTAQPMATAMGTGEPVMAEATWGYGQSWLMGFDLLATLQDSGASFWNAYATQQLLAFTPVPSAESALAGSSLPLRTTVRSHEPQGGATQDIKVRVQLPDGIDHADVVPTPAHDEAQRVDWAWNLQPEDSMTGEMRLILPQTSASLQIQTTLLDDRDESLDVLTQPISVLGLDILHPQIEVALNTLSSTEVVTQALIEQAHQAATAAKAAQQQGDWDVALHELANLQDLLDTLAMAPHSLSIDMLRLNVARWIGITQQQWTSGHAGDSSQPARLEIVSGAGQSALVSTAFASPLQVRVVDDQEQPVAGVVVRFSAPADGASAGFTGHVSSVDVVTDDQGLASITLTANATVGRYEVMARVDGLTPVRFNLGNRSDDTAHAPATLRLVSGAAQAAQIGTSFDAPMVVQVLNASGQLLPGIPVRFTFDAQGASAHFADGQMTVTVITDEQGLATSPVFIANQIAGTHQAQASVTGLQALTFTLKNSSQPLTLSLQAVGGLEQSAVIHTAYDQPMKVKVYDAQGRPQTGAVVQFSLPDTGPSASFGGNQLMASISTDAEGMAQSPAFVANDQLGRFQVVITAEGVAQPLYATLTNLALPAASDKQFEGSTATGTGAFTATVSGGGDTCKFNPNVTRLIPPEGVWTPLQKFLLPHGLFDFELVGCEPGNEVTISTTWPDLRGITGYMKYGKTPHSRDKEIWYAPKNLSINIRNNTVTYTIRDGELGDDDLTRNGVIRDPGGPAIERASEAVPIPTLDRWAMLLLAALIGLTALLHLKPGSRRSRRYVP